MPKQMEALSHFRNMSHILDLMLQGDVVFAGWTQHRRGSVGVLAFSEWTALLISDVNLFPRSGEGTICSIRSALVYISLSAQQ